MVNFEEYYKKSLQALTKYIVQEEQRPTEKKWNKIAVTNHYLSSETIGYMCKIGFNKLCKKIIKEVRNKI